MYEKSLTVGGGSSVRSLTIVSLMSFEVTLLGFQDGVIIISVRLCHFKAKSILVSIYRLRLIPYGIPGISECCRMPFLVATLVVAILFQTSIMCLSVIFSRHATSRLVTEP